ncbi:MAG: bifunctional oligoribonuclease/PAP phosphatase NrnA [Clostridia bacterium]|nr:bifunctional oligoribonuclease/PAP phosphatase NrnA [Clostridia bacterium]
MYNQALELIKKYDTIIIHRHTSPDGDAIGSQVGLKHVILANFPNKTVYIVGDLTKRYAFVEDWEPNEIDDQTYNGALAIVLDSGAPHLVSDERYTLAEATLRFDHHLFVEKFCDVEIVDTSFESCCGLIAHFAKHCNLTMDSIGAKALYTGMVTDSGRFRYESTNGDTMRLAGMLMDMGINTEWLFANLYLQDFDSFKFESFVHENMKRSPNGVVHIHIDDEIQQKFGLTLEQASEAVSFMNSIKGSLCWLAFINCPDGTIRVRLRSRFMEINALAEKYGGGGHQCTAGATLTDANDIAKMVADADEMVADYKNTHEGWL